MLTAASAISSAFNRALDAKLDEIEADAPWFGPTPVITRFDLHAALSTARATLSASGANALDACFDSEIYHDSSDAKRVFHPDCAPVNGSGAPRFGEFVFFDGIHPSGVAHAALGDALRALL